MSNKNDIKISNAPWWQGAVIYQIYPRSFMDANNDGIGDIPGIINKFSYIESLGVDAIWVSPFFKSPMKDFGYDISDYRNIDPIFGSLDDFDQLIEKAKAADIKVIIDQVLSHTSDQHQWFTESRENKTNAKADWYVWADAKPDGTPPNNWLSIFGGSAWQWEPRRGQYYLHNFLTSQPDLNFHNEDVRQAVLDNVEFWLKRGVNGFRLDAINFCFHDKYLRDNPAKAPADRVGRGFSEDNPYAFQRHDYNNTQPENLGFMEELRTLFDRYDSIVTLGEISSEDSLKDMAEYTQGNKRLNMAYSFELLTDDFSPRYIRQTIESLEQQMSDGWPCWAVSNHDVQRVATRWGKEHANADVAKLCIALLGSLRGSICTYQGEELGLTEANVPFEQLQDPYGIAFWPEFKGRDGCRTPLPWSADKQNAGFSSSTPWLPVPSEHHKFSIDQQENDDNSVLSAYKKFNQWRNAHAALRIGDIEFIESTDELLIFTRTISGSNEKLLAVFNLSANTVKTTLNIAISNELSCGIFQPAVVNGQQLEISGFSAFFAELETH